MQISILLLFCFSLVHPLLTPVAPSVHAAEREAQWQQQFLVVDPAADLRVKQQKEQIRQSTEGYFGVIPPLLSPDTLPTFGPDFVDIPPCRTGILYTQTTASDL